MPISYDARYDALLDAEACAEQAAKHAARVVFLAQIAYDTASEDFENWLIMRADAAARMARAEAIASSECMTYARASEPEPRA